jgi:hypothetical protein
MLYILTIVLDGMPWISSHLHQFERLSVPWHWIVAEGRADGILDTGWCKRLPGRLSNDGTTEYLDDLSYHPNVTRLSQDLWPGKTAMFNAMLDFCQKPGVLMQVDSDELWTSEQLERVVEMFRVNPANDCAYFPCDYRVGPNLRCVTENAYGNNPGEWLRAWRYTPGMQFVSHEPPRLGSSPVNPIPRKHTASLGLKFFHPAYATEKQVALKEEYYNYPGAVSQWRVLQANTKWPAKLKDFLHWVDDRVVVDQVCKTP